jgi:hypothetical protein
MNCGKAFNDKSKDFRQYCTRLGADLSFCLLSISPFHKYGSRSITLSLGFDIFYHPIGKHNSFVESIIGNIKGGKS